MRGQVVGDHHVARLQRWHQLGLCLEVERGAVRAEIQHPGRAKFVDPQAGYEGQGAPVIEGRIGFESVTVQGSAA